MAEQGTARPPRGTPFTPTRALKYIPEKYKYILLSDMYFCAPKSLQELCKTF